MNGTLLTLFRHKTWATLRLIEYCRGLDPAHLDATTPGTYGTIRQTLRHLVAGEEGYFSMLTRERVTTPLMIDGVVILEELPEGPVPLDELAARLRRLGPRWEAMAQDPAVPGREVSSQDGWRMPAAIPMAQAIHHADDHRSHVLSILGARGLPTPEPNGLDLWGYAQATGVAQAPAKAAPGG